MANVAPVGRGAPRLRADGDGSGPGLLLERDRPSTQWHEGDHVIDLTDASLALTA